MEIPQIKHFTQTHRIKMI